MGSRTDDKLKEIEEVRASLGRKLEEIESRFPLAGFGKKAAAALAGSSVAGSALAFGFRRMRGGRRAKKKALKQAAIAPTFPASMQINVLPKGAAWLAAAGVVAWAGVKAYETIQRSRDGSPSSARRPAVVTQMPEAGRQSGAGV